MNTLQVTGKSHLGLNMHTRTHCRWLVHTAPPWNHTWGWTHKQHTASDWYTQLPHEITPGAEHTNNTHCNEITPGAEHTYTAQVPHEITPGAEHTNNTLQVTGTHSSPMKSHLGLNTHKQHTASDWYTQLPHEITPGAEHTQTTHCKWLVHTASPHSCVFLRKPDLTWGWIRTNNTLQVTGTQSHISAASCQGCTRANPESV